MRTLEHPGVAARPRRVACGARSIGALLTLVPGRSIMAQLGEAVRALGSDSGYAEVFSGSLAPVSYCVPAGGDGSRAVTFSDQRVLERAQLIYGAATIGLRAGEPFVHSHCLWQDAAGRHLGGHLWPGTLAGDPAPRAAVYATRGVRWLSGDDPETGMPVFTPCTDERSTMAEKADAVGASIETVVARVRPNEDLLSAVVALCETHGLASAVVRGGLGSLVGATLLDPATGRHRRVDGPGTEVISLMGSVDLVDGSYETRIACTLVDRHGVVHAGELVRGENAVAVTFELILQRVR